MATHASIGSLLGSPLRRAAVLALTLTCLLVQPADAQKRPSASNEPPAPVSAIAISGDGQRLVSGSHDGKIRLWEMGTGKLQRTMSAHREAGPDSSGVVDIVFAPDGKSVVSAGDNTIRFWDFGTNKAFRTIRHKGGWPSALDINDSGRLVYAAEDFSVTIMNVNDGARLHSLKGHADYVRSVKFSPDGRFVLTACDDGVVRLWNVSDGSLRHAIRGHRGRVFAAIFSPDGATIAFAGDAAKIYLAASETGSISRVLPGHSGRIHALAFSHDGSRLLSGAGYQDHSVRLWETSNGRLLHIYKGHDAAVNDVAFSPNGEDAYSAGMDSRLLRLNLTTPSKVVELHGPSGEQASSRRR